MEELTVKQTKQEPAYANCGLNERKTTIWSNNITRIVQEKSLVKMEHQKNTQHNTLIFTEHGFSQSWDSTSKTRIWKYDQPFLESFPAGSRVSVTSMVEF